MLLNYGRFGKIVKLVVKITNLLKYSFFLMKKYLLSNSGITNKDSKYSFEWKLWDSFYLDWFCKITILIDKIVNLFKIKTIKYNSKYDCGEITNW